MNKSNFLETSKFPLESERLAELQESFNEISSAIAGQYGDNTIISGMEVINGNRTAGYFTYGGRIIRFKETTDTGYILIKSEIVSVAYLAETFNVYAREWAECVSYGTIGAISISSLKYATYTMLDNSPKEMPVAFSKEYYENGSTRRGDLSFCWINPELVYITGTLSFYKEELSGNSVNINTEIPNYNFYPSQAFNVECVVMKITAEAATYTPIFTVSTEVSTTTSSKSLKFTINPFSTSPNIDVYYFKLSHFFKVIRENN